MATGAHVVVVPLDGVQRAGDAALLRADAPMICRGAGVFETLLLRGRTPCLLSDHLARLGASAARVGLPATDPLPWRDAVGVAAASWPRDAGAEAVLRLCYGWGEADRPFGFVTVSPMPERVSAARRDGVSAVTLDRGVSSRPAPWSLADAKSSSYGVHAAALCEAARLGADDAVYTSVDGYVLEGPRSSVVIAMAGELLTPPPTLPILPGTTARALSSVASQRGVTCREAGFGVAELLGAQGVWLLSSITLAARVRMLNGVPLALDAAAPPVAELIEEALVGDLADDG